MKPRHRASQGKRKAHVYDGVPAGNAIFTTDPPEVSLETIIQARLFELDYPARRTRPPGGPAGRSCRGVRTPGRTVTKRRDNCEAESNHHRRRAARCNGCTCRDDLSEMLGAGPCR